MAIEFPRFDIPVRLRRIGKERALLVVGGRGMETRIDLSPDPQASSELLDVFTGLIRTTSRHLDVPSDGAIRRLTLEVDDPRLAGPPREVGLRDRLMAAGFEIDFAVRTSAVSPRVASLPVAPPYRVAHVDARADHDLMGPLENVLGERPPEKRDRAIQLRRFSLDELAEKAGTRAWPNAEVLYFDDYPWPESEEKLLSMASVETPGSLGWLFRLVDGLMSRLVVLRLEDRWSGPSYDRGDPRFFARVLLTALARIGGPAGLVLPKAGSDYPLFEALVHDRPLDHPYHYWGDPTQVSLFLGSGRSEILRGSQIGRRILEVRSELELLKKKGKKREKAGRSLTCAPGP